MDYDPTTHYLYKTGLAMGVGRADLASCTSPDAVRDLVMAHMRERGRRVHEATQARKARKIADRIAGR